MSSIESPANAADDLVDFLNASPTPWHAVAEARRRLIANGFLELSERIPFQIAPGGRYFVIRGGGSIAAFIAGNQSPSVTGFRWIGAHTDSPNLRLKLLPMSVRGNNHVVSSEVYGGVLLHTWLDRDLSVGGNVIIQTSQGLETQLVRRDLVAKIPSLAIHLDRQVNQDGLKINPQDHLAALTGLALSEKAPEIDLASWLGLDATLGKGAKLHAFDLAFFDSQPASRIGQRQEYISSGRLDNLAMCHAALSALISGSSTADATRGIVLFDHEECGSQSHHGAQSTLLSDIMTRVTSSFDQTSDAMMRAMRHSLLVSADMAHALHPNHVAKHEPKHQPLLGKGPVLKSNVNQRYATDGWSWALVEQAAEHAKVSIQKFVTRTDLACGTTIGPIIAALTGMTVVDIGNPMLSMHSIREMCSANDVQPMIDLQRQLLNTDQVWQNQ